MYLVDRSVLQFRVALSACSQNSHILSVSRIAGHTVISFSRPFAFASGQYVFVNFPSISLTEYHPFSICSSPFDDELSIAVKDMGAGTFTHQLPSLAQLPPNSACILEGPHGNPPLLTGLVYAFCCLLVCFGDIFKKKDIFRHFESLVFIAGGVGITPISSYLQALTVDENKQPDLRVSLVWVVRSADVLQILPAVSSLRARGCIHLAQFYVTQQKGQDEEANAAVRFGRPDFDQVLQETAQGRTLVFTCGPDAMVRQVKAKARAKRHSVYTEEFSF
jgi:NAD(P)H-flavin reductase